MSGQEKAGNRSRCEVLRWVGCFFFNDTATTEIYTLSLHDALPIWAPRQHSSLFLQEPSMRCLFLLDRKSTRLNSSHQISSYAVFCLKKKKLHIIYCSNYRAGARLDTSEFESVGR